MTGLTNMDGFYWKKRDSDYNPDCYVSPEGKILGKLKDTRESNTWSASVWSGVDSQFILLGVYVTEELAKDAIEWHCEWDKWRKELEQKRLINQINGPW